MLRFAFAMLIAAPVVLAANLSLAQERGQNSGQNSGPGGFLNNLFSRGEPQNAPPQSAPQQGGVPADDAGRLGRIENALRELTGTIERLQHENQQLKAQLQRMQEDNEFRFRDLGAKSPPPSSRSAAPPAARQPPPQTQPGQPQSQPGRRSDVFDPTQNPNAPGAPRALGGNVASNAPGSAAGNSVPGTAPIMEPETAPIGAPGGRAAGAPLDLSTLAGNAASAAPPAGALQQQSQGGRAGPQMATLAPSQSPKDEYDLAYGYVLRKDYALAEQAFQTFLKKHQTSTLEPDVRYWLGETFFQRQRYQDAADSFLVVVRNFESSPKAPEAMLRLGQSLAAMEQKELACASLGEVARKYPRASGSVKRTVEQEQKRIKC